MIVSGSVLVGFTGWYFWNYPSQHNAPEFQSNISDEQRGELVNLNKYMMGDRTLQLMSQMKYNIMVQAQRTEYLEKNPGASFPYFLYANGGIVVLRVREENWDHKKIFLGMTVGGSGAGVKEDASDVSYFISRPEDVMDSERLSVFVNSLTLPDSVMTPLNNYKYSLGINGEILADILNEYRHKDFRYFSKADIPGSKFYGTVSNEFARRMIPLGPLQEKVRSAIRAALKPK